jgi:putative FmdB family regulatory protein
MQKYQYRCEKCGAMFEHAEPLDEREPAHLKCPRCGSEKIQHIPIRWTPVVKQSAAFYRTTNRRAIVNTNPIASFAGTARCVRNARTAPMQ